MLGFDVSSPAESEILSGMSKLCVCDGGVADAAGSDGAEGAGALGVSEPVVLTVDFAAENERRGIGVIPCGLDTVEDLPLAFLAAGTNVSEEGRFDLDDGMRIVDDEATLVALP